MINGFVLFYATVINFSVSDVIHHLVLEYTQNNPITVIATVTNKSNLNKRIYMSRGRHLFQTIIQIPDLEKVSQSPRTLQWILKQLFFTGWSITNHHRIVPKIQVQQIKFRKVCEFNRRIHYRRFDAAYRTSYILCLPAWYAKLPINQLIKWTDRHMIRLQIHPFQLLPMIFSSNPWRWPIIIVFKESKTTINSLRLTTILKPIAFLVWNLS